MTNSQSAILIPTRYKYKSTGGAGGYATVDLYEDEYLERSVVLKHLQAQGDDSQLRTELEAISRIKSKHVVQIFDVALKRNSEIGGIFIEYVDGDDLNDFYLSVEKNLFDYQLVLFQIACALVDIHSCDVIHRDLKLANIRRNKERLIKLFDFGISATTPNYRTDTSRGTILYRPPEMYHPPSIVSENVDIYAFGVCAWSLAVGERNVPVELQQIPPQTTDYVPSIDTVLPSLPIDVCHLIDQCLNRNPLERPDATTIRNLLHAHLVSGSHTAAFIHRNNLHICSKSNPQTKIDCNHLGTLIISYNDISFSVKSVSGDVYINRNAAKANDIIPSSCVLTFGNPSLPRSREFVSFNSSQPEVVL